MSGQSGSVFIEALIAAAIVSMILAAGFQVTADSANRRRMVEARRYALMVARSQMAAVGYSIPLTAGAADGRDGPAHWRVDNPPRAREAGGRAPRPRGAAGVHPTPRPAGAAPARHGPDLWRVDMQPCALEAGDSALGALYCVAVSVRDARGGPPLVTLKSRRLAPPV